jgi:soluble lytic murein transglycosylase-like protein
MSSGYVGIREVTTRAAVRRLFLAACLTLPLFGTPGLARADCFEEAARYHKVNPWILRAIAAQESKFNPAAIGHNSNDTEDIGMFGTNSVHLPELARYGISRSDLFDGCKSAYIAAWRLSKMVKKYGNTWDAAGAYHSETPVHRDRYAAIIRRIVEYWISVGLVRPQ